MGAGNKTASGSRRLQDERAMTEHVYFDQSLPKFLTVLSAELPKDVIEHNLFLRDAAGRLTFVVADERISSSDRVRLSALLAEKVAPYADDDGFAVATPAELFDDALSEQDIGLRLTIKAEKIKFNIRLVDRRIVGADWLQLPVKASGIPRIVFASLKGGVGRSTALCVAAAALISKGVRVLVIDLDVEAPGLGSMLLTPQTTPNAGLLDYFVESNLGLSADAMFPDMVAASWFADGRGIIDVIPALGSATAQYPENVLAKIARAYVSAADGYADGITSRLRSLLDYASSTSKYDVILIDARAGLHETTGAALLGVGAHIAFFGLGQPQTYAAYDLLFANLALVNKDDWEKSITIVHAKASASLDKQNDFSTRFRKMLSSRFGGESAPVTVDLAAMRDVFQVEWIEDGLLQDLQADAVLAESGEQFAVTQILESESFRDFDPLSIPDQLESGIYLTVYRAFLISIAQIVGLDAQDLIDE